MKLEAVVTCVRYGDFLAQSLPHNRSLFDRMVVVTSYDDRETQRVCEYWHVECVKTHAFEAHLDLFSKGAGINVGLGLLDKNAWLVHLDSDIVLPPLTRRLLEMMDLDPTFLYGIDRFMCRSFADWSNFVAEPRLQHENRSWVHLDSFPLGTRVVMESYQGYVPIGFFQLWHAASGVVTYPDCHKDAGRTDMLFAANWPRAKRAMIPEIIGYHLESERAAMGTNWNGRKTKRFALGAPGRALDPTAPAGY